MDSPEALAYLGQIGERTSLRHAVQLLTPAAMMAKTSGRDEISSSDVEPVPRCQVHGQAIGRTGR